MYQPDFKKRLKQHPTFDLYESMAAGGFPEPLQRTNHRRRQAWFDAYIATILDRDIRSLSNIQDFTAVPNLLELIAARIGTLHNQSEISRSSGIPNSKLSRYLALLRATFLIQDLPAWSTNLGKRLVKAPKRFMVDTGLACSLLGMHADRLRQGGEVVGRLFENFVVLEFFKHSAWAGKLVRLYHFRSQQGQEVDVVLEDGSGNIVGIEIKLSATPSPKDFAGLKFLQERLKKQFARGVLVYTGRDVIPFGKNLHAVPIQCILGTRNG